VAFENLVQGYDEATDRVAIVMSSEDLVCWAPYDPFAARLLSSPTWIFCFLILVGCRSREGSS
jgi:hypothetical protein